jgi:hypothetical protein
MATASILGLAFFKQLNFAVETLKKQLDPSRCPTGILILKGQEVNGNGTTLILDSAGY